MVNIDASYITRSKAHGRTVSCRIIAGELSFDNSSIIDFEFDDVVHPSELCFGSACANRFHFSLRTDEEIPLSAVIEPFVYFAGCSTGCPLGKFYISYRTRRDGFYRVTCYDRMYFLTGEYETALTLPQSSRALFSELCGRLGIDASFSVPSCPCTKVPEGTSDRDMLGYFAGISGGCAKFGRDGVLRCVKSTAQVHSVGKNNYMELSLSSDLLSVGKIEVDNGDRLYSTGEGNRLSAYRWYCPFGSQKIADMIALGWNGFSYYALDLTLQGLPYLEAGDVISVEDADGVYRRAIIGEYILSFDGSLTGRIFSRGKSPTDEYELTSATERELEAKSAASRISILSYENGEAVSFSGTETELFGMELSGEAGSSAVLDVQLTLTATSEDTTVRLRPYLGINPLPHIATARLHLGEPTNLSLRSAFSLPSTAVCRVSVFGASEGDCHAARNQISATIIGASLVGGAGTAGQPFILTEETVGNIALGLPQISMVGFEESLTGGTDD